MNISNRLRRSYVFCCAGFTPVPDTQGYESYENDHGKKPNSWESAAVDSCWIFQYSKFGASWSFIPILDGSLPPSRVELIVPDQTKWPSNLWSCLDARDSVHTTGSRVESLGICHYLRAALQLWSNSMADFYEYYTTLPFGSRIRLTAVTEDVHDTEFKLLPNECIVDSTLFLPIDHLTGMWDLEPSSIPPLIQFTDLVFEKQLAGEVILVSPKDNRSKKLAFKSARFSPSTIYHEIKLLLNMPPSPTIVERPEYLVTLPSENNKGTVCGFLLRYYSGGSLDQVLPSRRLAGTLMMRQQLGWAKDITSALIHVRESPAKFYSDLRLDQLVLGENEDGSETAILLDFEQSRNIYNWAPPEIYFLEWIAELGSLAYARTEELPEDVLSKYGNILDEYLKSRGQKTPIQETSWHYDNPPLGWYWPWVTSTAKERESGMVYMLGKALWCIFEGMEDADIVLGRSGTFNERQRFPEFVRTPAAVRGLIEECTQGAREWIDGPIKIYRRGGKVFPLGKTGLDGEEEGTLEETQQTIRDFWRNEMDKAEKFVAARMRYDAGKASEDDLQLLHYLRRPSLDQAMAALENFEKTADL